MTEDITFEISGDDGSDDSVTIPRAMLELLTEDDEPPAQVVGDLALFGCAERIHAVVHHAEGEADPHLAEVEEATMELFEDRFGASYGELTGHAH